jgi:hypothetical protein
MPIGCHPLPSVTDHLDSLRSSKRLAASTSRFSLEPRVEEIPLPSAGPREGAHVPLDTAIRFIDLAGSAHLPAALHSQLVIQERSKARLRVSDCLARDLTTSRQKHLSQIPETQLITEPPEHDEDDDLSGIVEKVAWRPPTFVEGVLAG